MAEVFGLGVNIATVIDLSAKVALKCVQYASEVKNARVGISRVHRETLYLKIVAEKTKELLEGDHRARLQASRDLSDAVQETIGRLHHLHAELSPPSTAPRLWALRALQWPFQSKDVERVVQDIVRCTQTISASLQIDQISILVNLDQTTVLNKLPTASGASFDSYAEESNPTCLPNTRVDLLKQIRTWVDDPTALAVFWLNGMAGTGKSTISRTVAKFLADTNKLGASFFFKRGENDCSNASKLFTTVASQLARRVPTLAGHITEAIDTDLTILNMGLQKQFETLILKPLFRIQGDTSYRASITVVVDALDECEREDDVKMIVNLFSRAKNLQSPRLKVLLTSRPELPVRLGFKQKAVEGTYTSLILHEIPEHIVQHDISVFLEHQLALIKDSYNSTVPSERQLPSTWPSQYNIQTLVKMSVPLFIFATTTCRFLQKRGFGGPEQQLRQVLDYKTRAESSELDLSAKFELTYQPALNQQLADLSSSEQDATIKQFRRIIGPIVVLSSPLSTTTLGQLLDIPRQIIDNRLDLLHSVLDVPQSLKLPVRLLHLSFRDFLVDPKQRYTNPFWVDENDTHRQLALRCLAVLRNHLRADICNLQSPATLQSTVDPLKVNNCLPPEVQYACLHWIYHTLEAQVSSDLASDVYNFLSQHFLHWIEALSLLGRLSDGALALQELLKSIKTSSELSDFIKDATRVISSFGSIIKYAPLQIYSTLLLFSPVYSQVRQAFWDQRLPSLPTVQGVKSNWDSRRQTLSGHQHWVYSVAFSPDGQTLASASYDETVRLWDVGTGTHRQTLEGHNGPADSVAFSPDGQTLASVSDDKTIRLWDVATGTQRQILEGHSNRVRSVAFSPDGQTLASASYDKTVRLWDVATGAYRQTLEGHNGWLKSVAFSPDGQTLASASDNGTVWLWNVATGTQRQTLKGHSRYVRSVAFSPDGQTLASASENRTILFWDVDTGTHRQTLEGHSSRVRSVAFSPDGQTLASASYDKTVRLWDVATGTNWQTLEGHSDWVRSVAFSPDGQTLASASGDRTVRLWDVATSTHWQALKGHSNRVTSVAFSPDRKTLALAFNDSTVQLWDVATGAYRQALKGHSNWVRSVVFSPNGQILASASGDRTIRLWDVATGTQRQTLKGHSDWVRSVAFSPDGQTLASASGDRTVRLWDVATSTHRQTLEGHSNWITSVAFSPNGQTLASASDDGTVRLWGVATGTHRQTLKEQTLEGHSRYVRSVAFSPDGQTLASASENRTVLFWDVATGTHRQTLEGHSDWVRSVAFSPDGQTLASASDDKTIRLWDVATGTQRQILDLGFTKSLTFGPLSSTRLLTDFGTIDLLSNPLTSEGPTANRPTTQPIIDGIGLSPDRTWIVRGNEKIIWLPLEYRSTVSVVTDSMLCIRSA